MTALTLKKKRKSAPKLKDTVGKVKDLDNHPFFVKKAKAAEAFLKKHGLPNEFKK
jgi:hypothetical protein